MATAITRLSSDFWVSQEIISYDNFLNLSEEWQQQLCTLLPPTAFFTYQASAASLAGGNVGGEPSSSSLESPESTVERTPELLDPMFFTNPFFLSAAGTFQDQLFSGWYAEKDKAKVQQYLQGVRDGTMHAQWKDEEWSEDHPPPKHASK